MQVSPSALSLSLVNALRALLAFWLFAGCSSTNLTGPFFATSPVLSAPVDEVYSYDAFAAGLTLPQTWWLTTAPVGMTVDANGLIEWTPVLADMGLHDVSVTVTDGPRTLHQSWVITVHQDLLLGVTYSPKNHSTASSDDDVIEFLTTSDPWGRLIAFHSTWRDSIADAGLTPEVGLFAQTAKATYLIEPAVGFGWAAGDGTPDLLSDGDMADNSWSNQETRDEFLALVTNYAFNYAPTHLFLGNEVNIWNDVDPAGWADWLSMLEECYDAIKSNSPNTIVFTVFQLERMKGLGAGTTGWPAMAQWNLVDDIAASGKVDAIGFTSYPYFEFATPQAIPADYYDEIGMHWKGPVIFSEIGWPATADAPFPGDATQQLDFVNEFFDRIEGIEVEYAVWLFLHDSDQQLSMPGFLDIGFRNNDGTLVRPSDAVWQAAVDLRERPDF